MWSRQLLLTAAVPVYPAEELGPRQHRCAGQLQLLTRRLVRLCELTATSGDSPHTEPMDGDKLTADAVVDAREQPGRVPPLPDLVQSCAAADAAREEQEAGEEEVAGRPVPGRDMARPGQVTAAAADAAAPPDTARLVGRSLRRCADQLQSARHKRRAAPPPPLLRRAGRTVPASTALLSVSALLLLWYCRR